MKQSTRRVLFFLFFVSGFCGLAYQVIWTRMAFASFGIILPVLSVVLSVFMLGLSVGSWLGGRWIAALVRSTGRSAALFYALAELSIGLGAFAVPKLFALGENFLLASGETDSFRYLFLSALVLAVSILPWCLCMGTTFPFMMAFIRERDSRNAESFSFLYLANVLGAMAGVFLTAVVLIEVFGFRHTLWLAAAGNFTIALVAVGLGWKQASKDPAPQTNRGPAGTAVESRPRQLGDRAIKWILFSTGFVAMAMEVVWTRAFIPVLKTQVYSFALIVFAYLLATFVGSRLYRRDLHRNRVRSTGTLMFGLAIAALLPVLANDPRFVAADYWEMSMHPKAAVFLLASLCPFCALLGYLTPRLIDEFGAGDPARAGRAYAINVLGCILGPLFAGYVLLPNMSERGGLILLSLPFVVFEAGLLRSERPHRRWALGAGIAAMLAWALFGSQDFEGKLFATEKHTTVRRDYAATTISFGEGWGRSLLVNGIGMTKLTPITKCMVHWPLMFHEGKPESALVICFGMGTTFRSALSWDIDTTAVELVPGVTQAYGFYHEDAAEVLKNPRGHIVIDDGRRYLRRTAKKFDVIVVDPPPPLEAAGSSLLFSREFYTLARQHLQPHGILQMWLPGGESNSCVAVVRTIHESFPYVRTFSSVEHWGLHLLGSMEPIGPLDAGQLAARLPETARRDLMEWTDVPTPAAYIGLSISNEQPLPKLPGPDLRIEITDDRPFNEYFLLRWMRQ